MGSPITDPVPFRVVLPKEMDDALGLVTTMSGVSKSSVIRRGVALVLTELGVWDSEAAQRVEATPTTIPARARLSVEARS